MSFINAYSSSLELYNNTFMDGGDFEEYGKAVYCECINFTAENNTFKNLYALQGGAIYLSST
jgi:hypothetical protein